MKKIMVGDVFELETSAGKAYLHYIYEEPDFGELIRVLPGLYQERPSNLNEIVAEKERYMIFFPLKAAHRRSIVCKVGHVSAGAYAKPAFMRSDHWERFEFKGWHIVDTKTWRMQLVSELTDEQVKLSPWGIWNDTLLCERLAENWSLEQWGHDYGSSEQVQNE